MKAAAEHDLRAPYPGLRPFQPPESPIFFGRARQTNEMLKRLERQRFLAVVGASGSGKSSLVRAGLLPALQDGYLRGVSSDWRFVIARPGVDPYGNLAEAFCRGQGAEREPTGFELSLAESVLRSGRRGVAELLHKFDVPGDRPVLLLIDQFEELFRFREAARRLAGQAAPDGYQQRNDAIQFVDLLLRTAEQADRPVYVILTMRSEFMGDCDAFFGLPEAISASQFLTPRLTRDQSAEAIEGPLDQFHGEIAPEVVNQIVNEVGSDPDQLPLMQHALLRMWQLACDEAGVPSDAGPRSPDTPLVTLSEQHYGTAGRVAKALDLHASGIYAELGRMAPDTQARSASEGESVVTSPDTQARSASEGESASVPRLRVGLVSVAAEPSPQQRIAQWLFRCLAERTPQGVLVRRLTTIGEVATVAGVPAAEVAEVVAAFTGPGRDFLVLSRVGVDGPSPSLSPRPGTPGRGVGGEGFGASPHASTPVGATPTADGTEELHGLGSPRRMEPLTPTLSPEYRGEGASMRNVQASLTAATTIDISHESLLRQWQQLREWVTAEADAADELRKLVRDAKDWDHGLRNLLRQPELGVFRQWRDERVPSPAWAARYASADEFELADRYLDESGKQEEREQQEEKDARQRELELERRRTAEAEAAAARQRRLSRIAFVSAGVAVLFGLVVIALAVFLNRQIDQGTEALVNALLVAPPESLPKAIDSLKSFQGPATLKLQAVVKDAGNEPQHRLHAGCALSEFGDLDGDVVEAVLTSIPRGPAGECPNIVWALRPVRDDALRTIAQRFEQSKQPEERVHYATVALHLGNLATASRLLVLHKDPANRTAFIHNYFKWPGDLAELAPILRESKAGAGREKADLRSGLCAALGLIPLETLTESQRRALIAALTELHQQAPDGGTHSAAYFALRRWRQEKAIRDLTPSKLLPAEDRGWFVNSLGMTMVRIIPRGSFTMGDNSSLAAEEEKPPHEVTLTQDFYLGDREVTVRQFKRFVQEAADQPKCKDEKQIAESWDGEDKQWSPEEDCPVQKVSWFQAVAFCNWLSHFEKLTPCYGLSRTGTNDKSDWKCDLNAKASGYRLPTEAQWEYACRAVSQTQYAFGDDAALLAEYGYYSSNSVGRTWPGGEKLPNGWGLFDMHGNVWEWCHDGYASYKDSASSDPSGDEAASARVIRGGSWVDDAGSCRAAVRFRNEPQYRHDFLGFRVAAVPQAKSSPGPGAR